MVRLPTNLKKQEPFRDVAGLLKLDINNMAGGVIVEDFDNDTYLDIVTSSWGLDESMHFFRNDKAGGFIDQSKGSRLKDLTGGLNIMQMDFNNDGFKDIFVLRGAWLRGNYGQQPNSLLRNNGDGTFTDVTVKTGVSGGGFGMGVAAADYDGDGFQDLYVTIVAEQTTRTGLVMPRDTVVTPILIVGA